MAKNLSVIPKERNQSKILTQEELKRQLKYNPTTGKFMWRVSNVSHVQIGDLAGYLEDSGYITIGINKKVYRAHRLAWLYMEGYFPKNICIDHINRNPSDNKWKNLRLISMQCNIRNAKKQRNNTSGITGIYWNKIFKKWISQIKIMNKTHYIGASTDLNEVILMRLSVEQCLNWEGCNSTSPAFLYAKKHIFIKQNFIGEKQQPMKFKYKRRNRKSIEAKTCEQEI